jgi:hypothetical protein
MCRKRSASATCCIFDPGSVIAMKRLPALSAPMVCFTQLEKVLLENVWLERSAGQAGDDEQSPWQIYFVFECLDRRRIGGIEHVQFRDAGNLAES